MKYEDFRPLLVIGMFGGIALSGLLILSPLIAAVVYLLVLPVVVLVIYEAVAGGGDGR
jgi:hypothetical protein